MEFGAGTVAIIFFVAVAVLGPRFGADSRDGRDWQPTGPRSGGRRSAARERAKRQVALWEAYLTAHHPWRERGPLQWREVDGEWMLEGDTPPLPPSGDPDELRVGPSRDGS